jgi:hypothetical protein
MPFDPNKPFDVIAPTDPVDGDKTVVQDPNIGQVKYTPDWTPSDIQADLNQKRVEAKKIQAAAPQLSLREKFEQANTPSDKMRVLTEFAYAQGARGLGPAVGFYAGGVPGAIVGGIAGEAAARTIEGEPITMGSMAKAGIEAAPVIKSGQLISNALKLAGINVAGEAAQEAIDRKDLISLDAVAKQAARGGVQALLVAGAGKLLGGEKQAAKESQRKVDDTEIINGLTQANENRLVIDPVKFTAEKGQEFLKRKVMELSGTQDEFQKMASLVNEPRVMEMSREAAGAGKDAVLNDKFFVSRKYEAGEPYRQIKSLSQTAKDAVENWMEANADYSNAYRTIRETANAAARNDARSAAKAAKAEADAAFDVIKQEADKVGNPKLIERLQNARVELAKIHAVEAATNRGTAKPDARIFGMMWEDGAKLTGPLETLGRIGSIMPEVVTPAAEIGSKSITKAASGAGTVGKSIVGGSIGLLAGSRYGIEPAMATAMGTLAGAAASKAGAAIPPLLQQVQLQPAYQAAAFLPRYMDQYPGFKAEFLRFAAPNF